MNYTIRKAETPEDFTSVEELTYKEYLKEDYIEPNSDKKFKKFRRWDTLPETSVFIAKADDKIIGTISVTTNNLTGFPIDHDFPEDVEKIKHECIVTSKHLGYCWRIITDSGYRDRKLAFYLIKRAIEFMCENHVHVILFVFNPKHVGFYKKALGFSVVKEQEAVDSVNAPGVLMRSDARHLMIMWERVCQKMKIPYTAVIKDVWWPTAKADIPILERMYWWARFPFDYAVAWLIGWPILIAVTAFFWVEKKLTPSY